MRIALLSDIHGNRIALDAVLSDIAAQGGVDTYWVLGDLAAIGPQPVQVLERISQLPNVCVTRGNADRYTVTTERPGPTAEEVFANPALLPVFAQVAHTFAWTHGCLAATGWLSYLEDLPLEQRLQLPDGTRMLGVHSSPGSDHGDGLQPFQSDETVLALLKDCHADLICVGHTHWPMNQRVGQYHVINLGSVSNPVIPDLKASYAVLAATSSGYSVEHRRVVYDHAAVIDAVRAVRHPAGSFIIDVMLGKIVRHHWGEPAV